MVTYIKHTQFDSFYFCIPFLGVLQRYTYRVLQTIQMKLILSCTWAEPAILGSTKTALKFKNEIWIGYPTYYIGRI